MDDEPLELPSYEEIRASLEGLAARIAGRFGERIVNHALAAPDVFVLLARVVGDERVPRSRRGELVAATIYLVSPIDVIPETLFGPAGLVDDAVVVTRLLDVLLNGVPDEVVQDHWPGDRAVLEKLRGLAAEGRRIFSTGLEDGLRRLVRRGMRSLERKVQGAVPLLHTVFGGSPPERAEAIEERSQGKA